MNDVMANLESLTSEEGEQLVVRKAVLRRLADFAPDHKKIGKELALALFLDDERISSYCRGVQTHPPPAKQDLSYTAHGPRHHPDSEVEVQKMAAAQRTAELGGKERDDGP